MFIFYNVNKKKIIIIAILIVSILGLFSFSFGMTHYQTVDFSTGFVTASALNIRQGPSTSFKIITQVYKNEYIRVFARIGDWYVVQTDKDYVGMASVKYIKAIYPGSNNTNNQNSQNNVTTSSTLNADEKEVFNLINQQRTAAGLPALVIDEALQKVARVKAKDMVDKGYFSHTSPTYGSPFDMMKSFGVSYKTAGENIAGNSTNSGAVDAWMNSPGHKANILNNNYNYTGIGVVSSQKYGKVYVQMFIGK